MTNETTASEREPRKIEPGSDRHLTLIGAQWHFNLLTGKDREDMLAFGRAVWWAARAALPAPADQPPEPRGSSGSLPESGATAGPQGAASAAERSPGQIACEAFNKHQPIQVPWGTYPNVEADWERAAAAVISAIGRPSGTAEATCCPMCGGSGDGYMMENGGPDAREIAINCPHCDGDGTLEAAYRHLVKRVDEEHRKYLQVCGKLYFQGEAKA